MELKRADLGGPCLYADHGGAGRPLVLVHGLAGSHLNWMAVAPRLAEHHRVYALDLVGFGRTPLAGRSATLETNLELLTRFVEEVAGAPALVVGHSMGGLLTLQLAAARPDLVAAAVLVSAASPPGADAHAMPAEEEALIASLVEGDLAEVAPMAHAVVLAQGPEQLVDGAFAFMHRRPVAREIRDAHVAMEAERGQDPGTTLAYLQAYKDLRSRGDEFETFDAAVRAVRAPVLVVHGELDPVVPAANMRRAASLRPVWETLWLPGVGHGVQMEAPQEFLAAVIPFLSRPAGDPLRQSAAGASR